MQNFNFLLPATTMVEHQREIPKFRVAETLDKYGLHWQVDKKPWSLDGQQMTDFFAIKRRDTGEVLQSVKKGYVPFQNDLLMELAMSVADLCQTDISSAKSLKGGGLVYITIDGRKFELNGRKVGDVIKEQIVISNSHNGEIALRVAFGHVTLSCLNGMTRFDAKGSFAIRHTASMKDRLKTAIRKMPNILGESQRQVDAYHKLAEKPINGNHVSKVLQIITDQNPDAPEDKISPVGKNILAAAKDSFITEISSKGDTGWGLFSGVTHYTTKVAGASDSKLASKMFGHVAKREMKALDYLMSI